MYERRTGSSKSKRKPRIASSPEARGLATRFCKGESLPVKKLSRGGGRGTSVWRNFPFVKHSIFLARKDFVTKRHGRSARVLNLTESDIIHIYQIRGAPEGLAARIIAECKLPSQDIESAMRAIPVAVASNDALKVRDSVQRFHLCILEKTGNPLLLDTGKRLIVPLLGFTRMRVQVRT